VNAEDDHPSRADPALSRAQGGRRGAAATPIVERSFRRHGESGRAATRSQPDELEIACQLDGAAEGGPGLGQHRLREGFSRYVG
jgi:hypothetical protein